jgi:hypothetical protein
MFLFRLSVPTMGKPLFLTSSDFDRQGLARARGAWLNYPLRFGHLKEGFFEKTRSKKVLFLLDSCHSGDFFGAKYRRDMSIQHFLDQSFAKMSEGRVVLSSCLPLQKAREEETLGHGLFTYYLLQAFHGREKEAVRPNGMLTVSSLFDYLSDIMPPTQRPVEGGVKHGSFELLKYPEWNKTGQISAPLSAEISDQNTEKKLRLQKMLVNHRDFLQSRLDSFVGRVQELAEIQQRIEQKMAAGGYVTITGQAGQGKSSIIAKLIDLYGSETVAFHFIPFNPGPDYQVGLLRHIMARLILKYDLPELYVAGERRATFRDFFPHVLEDVAAKGGREIIFIDGLDQLEIDVNGQRDLSFLPNHLPAGIVCVLGTRPNDTLRPLELLQPHDEYFLPNLKRDDFDLILLHRQVSLDQALTDQFYQVMQENALYLDLVAKELHARGTLSPQELIARLAHNPDHIFSLTIDRLKKPATEWHEVLKPILGILLTTCEPLSGRQIRHILNIDHDRITDALSRLGGLLNLGGDHRYSLFHLRFQYYLRQDEQRPQKEYIFATDEEEHWHVQLAIWCEQGELPVIWRETTVSIEQERRKYARQHYLTHLYLSKQWQRLFEVLDQSQYGRRKVRYSSSTQGYIQDLELGRKAAGWGGWTLEEKITHLPYLWRYTLLRGRLTNHVDAYPDAAFKLLLLLNSDVEAVRNADLLTKPARKSDVFIIIVRFLIKQPERRTEGLQLLEQVYVNMPPFLGSDRKNWFPFAMLGKELAQVGEWQKAQDVIASIQDYNLKDLALIELSRELAQTNQWQKAQDVITDISDSKHKAKALATLAAALELAHLRQEAKHVWQEAQDVITDIGDSEHKAKALATLAAALELAHLRQEAKHVWQETRSMIASTKWKWSWSGPKDEALIDLSEALAQANQWQEAQDVITDISDSEHKAKALATLAAALELAHLRQEAKHVWQETRSMIASIERSRTKAEALKELGKALVRANLRQEAKHVWQEAFDCQLGAPRNWRTVDHLRVLGVLLYQAGFLQEATQVWKGASTNIPVNEDDSWVWKSLSETLAWANQWQEARTVIASIEDPKDKAEALTELALELAHANLREEAKQVWQEAQDVIVSIADYDSKKSDVLKELGLKLAQAGEWKEAQNVIASIQNHDKKDQALAELSRELTQAGEWKEAQNVIASIQNHDKKDQALAELNRGLAQDKQLQKVQNVAPSIRDDYFHTGTPVPERFKDLSQFLDLLQHTWLHLNTYDEALSALSQAYDLILFKPVLGSTFFQAFRWVETFLKGKNEAVL